MLCLPNVVNGECKLEIIKQHAYEACDRITEQMHMESRYRRMKFKRESVNITEDHIRYTNRKLFKFTDILCLFKNVFFFKL